jgi:hypothetical protein
MERLRGSSIGNPIAPSDPVESAKNVTPRIIDAHAEVSDLEKADQELLNTEDAENIKEAHQ